jgi:hypothetical protein
MRLSLRSFTSALAAITVALATPACADLLGLGKYTNLCGGQLDAPNVCLGGAGHASSNSAGGAGGAGGATSCTPDTVKSCYDGPDGTQDVGSCKHGQAICKASGDGYGACNGEVLPAVESCQTTEDENCDGLDCIELQQVLSTGQTTLADVVYSSSDDTYVLLAVASDALKFTNKTIIPVDASDVIVVKFKADGSAVWDRVITGAHNVQVADLAVDSKGRISLGGFTPTAITINGMSIAAGAFVLQLSSTGKVNWAKSLGGSDPLHVSATPDDDLIASAGFAGGLTFDDGAIPNAGIFIARISGDDGSNSKAPTGAKWCVYANMQFPGSLINRVDSAGNVYFAGYSTATINFGGMQLTNAGGSDWVFGKMKSSGGLTWAEDIGGSDNDTISALAVDPLGNLIMVGVFSFQFSHSPNFHFDPANGNALLVKFDTNQQMRWAHQYSAGAGALGLSADADSNVSIFAPFQNNLDFGNGSHPAGGMNNNAFVLAKLTSDSLPIWVRTYTVDAFLGPSAALALMPTGEAMAIANVSAPTDFGAGPTTTSGGSQALLRFGK